MDGDELRRAVKYNNDRGYSRSEIKLVQRTVGAFEDGVWGPDTVIKLADWQSRRGLKPDGKCGPRTWAEIKASWEGSPCHEVHRGRPMIGCGLAAYDNVFPGHTPEEAMERDFKTAVSLGCSEIRYWSSEWLIDDKLPNGGNKGNTYAGPWLKSLKPPTDVVIGCWVDDPAWNAKKEGFADHLVEMHVQRAAVMINKSNTMPSNVPWILRWDREDLEAVGKLYESKGIECVATCWPRPSRQQIDAMLADMRWILPTLRSKVFEVDTEGNWKPKFLDGFPSMRKAAEYLAEGMRELVGDEGELELTTYTYHAENGRGAVLAPLMDRLLPQAYSVRHRGNSLIDWDDPLGPGSHQKLAINRAMQAAKAKAPR